MKRKNPITLAAVWVALALLPAQAALAADGTITGSVSNAATTNLLEGARVEVPQLGLTALTDNTGRFVLTAVPAGTHEVIASYIGLDSVRSQVTVGAGERAVRNFDLTTGIYQLQEFKVTGEREGGAAAITAQRNADNLKNVVAMDFFGNLPNMSASEVAINLPGVAGNLSEAGLVVGFTIRGMSPGLNTVTMDGVLLTSRDDSMTRDTDLHVYSSAMFEQLELTKGHTPDKGADSLGGTVNLKSRSPLSMKEKRRVTYNFSGRWAPPFTQQIPLREAHRFHPLFNLGYQEVFSVFGGERNLGVAVNGFYSEHATGWFLTTRDFQNTTSTPAYVWDYRTTETYNPHYQQSLNIKLDYRYSPTTKFRLNTVAVDNNEKFRRRYETRAFTTQTVGTTGTAGILPGYTDRITQVRAAPGSTIDLTMTGPNNVFVRMRGVDVGAEHEFDRLQLDYKAAYNRSNVNRGNGKGGVLINRITNVGWILDRTQSDLYPRFVQTEGPDFTNPANFRPAPNGLANANADNDRAVKELHGNARYALPIPPQVFLKAGFVWRENSAKDYNRGRRWNYIGTSALPADPSILMFDTRMTGRRIPQWEASTFINQRVPVTPALWREDVYFFEQNKYTGTTAVTETIGAGYVMAQGKVGRTGFLAGVRTEKTDTESSGYVRVRTGSTAAQQAADPVGSAQRDYAGTRRELEGSYTKSFPSVHLHHDLTANLKARLSWSTSFGRPPMANLRPNETVNEANQTLSVNNPSLLPQTAANWDATLDYYFEPVGNFSVGWFHKTIEDYIVSGINSGTVPTGANNGYNGEYGGFTRLTTSNLGTAVVQGWEFNYQQQFTFLPGFLKGLSGSANYTVIDTHGDFGGTVTRSTNQVPGFIPRTGNLSLSWRHRGFSSRVAVNFTGDYITNYSAASLGRNLYRFKRTMVNVGLAYQVRPAVTLTCDVANLFNEPEAFYRGIPDQLQRMNLPGTSITFGVNGRF
ncbi:MAG: TonB-dependent receptor [Verrucomicrobia bacterium]|nr:TonB-dependent receptor [Verrucomicrobiota bacterium]